MKGWKTLREKGENAGFQHFLLFTQSFKEAIFSALLRLRIVCYRVKHVIGIGLGVKSGDKVEKIVPISLYLICRILDSSSSAVNKDMMSKIWRIGD